MTQTIERFIAESGGKYLTPRRATGAMYQNRSGFSYDLNDARVFNTKAAASNSANRAVKRGEEVNILTVEIRIKT